MTVDEILHWIRSRVGTEHLSDSCSGDGCRVFTTGVPTDRVIVDADRAFPAHNIEGKRCDYVLFFLSTAKDTLVVVPMELKSGRVDVSDASEQLQRGADFANRFAPAQSGVKPVCHPVLFHGKGLHNKERTDLNRTKVRFRGQRLTIKTARCGRQRNLASVLSKEISG